MKYKFSRFKLEIWFLIYGGFSEMQSLKQLMQDKLGKQPFK